MPRIGPGLRIRAPAMASLRDEKEAPSSGERVDFDAKLPLFGTLYLSLLSLLSVFISRKRF